MDVQIKILRTLYERVHRDLSRPHPSTGERVGFLFTNSGSSGNELQLILPVFYMTIPDSQYIPDINVGARINSAAIRNAMQRSMDTGQGVLHVHIHDRFGIPFFSKTDQKELLRLIPSFRTVTAKAPHGALLLSRDNAAAMVWLPDSSNSTAIKKISLVGYPTGFTGGGWVV